MANGTSESIGNFTRAEPYEILATQADGFELPEFQPYGNKQDIFHTI